MSGIGHNSGDDDDDLVGTRPDAEVGGIATDRLRSIIERIERLTDEKKALQDDIKDIMGEAASAGFDKKAIREILKIRRQDTQKQEAHEHMVDLYRRALGV